MTNPFGIGDLSSLGLPGANPMQATGLLDTMELVRKAWSSFALPPAMAPTIDPEEIERRIAELKAVEQWLVMNLTMLRGTVQALEIQRNTLAAMQAFGMPRQAMPGGPGEARPSAPPPPARPQHNWTPPPAPAPTPAGEMWPASALSQAHAAQAEARASYANAPPSEQAPGGMQAGMPPEEQLPPGSTGAPAPGQATINPAVWWDLLQKQFSQVASAALANMPGVGTGDGKEAGTHSGARPRSRSKSAAPGSGAKKATATRSAKSGGSGARPRSTATRTDIDLGARGARGRKTSSS